MAMELTRRRCLGAMAILMAATARPARAEGRPSTRLIIDNDFAGDPDGLFQLAHHILCPSVDIALIVGSHLPPAFGGETSAADAVAKVRALLAATNQAGRYPLVEGASLPIGSRAQPRPSAATAQIVREARRAVPGQPLLYAAGASLTELALAWLADPAIGPRVRLLWIGGPEHDGLAMPPPGPQEAEFNLATDPIAAQVIFSESDIEIWQVPRNVYRQMLLSKAELADLARKSPLGHHLAQQVALMEDKLASIPAFAAMPQTEAMILGDSPLVTLSALLSPVQPDTSSSAYRILPTPHLLADGHYRPNPGGRAMRVYTAIDVRLTIADMVARFSAPTR